MKYIVFIAVVLFILTCCEHADSPKIDTYCPPPEKNWAGEWKSPWPYHARQRASGDGENLVFFSDGEPILLNLNTGTVRYIDFRNKLPDNVRLSGAYQVFWCPYDNNRILLHADTGTDLPDDSIKRYYYGQNLYIVSLDGSEFKRVTPSIFGPVGAAGFYIYSWLPASKPGHDLIQMTADVPGINSIAKIYIPQTDEFSPAENDYLRAITKDGNYNFSGKERNADGRIIWDINGYEFVFNEEMGLDYSSFSPSGKYLALSVSPPSASWEERRFNEIWIINVEKFLSEKPDTVTPDKIINLRHDFCMYAMVATPCAEFITETTLAVAMYEDGDDVAYLWEVGINGELLGQLTFEP